MLCRFEVFRRVPVLRTVAATDMTTGTAESQMYPGVAGLQALLATVRTRFVRTYGIQMFTSHTSLPDFRCRSSKSTPKPANQEFPREQRTAEIAGSGHSPDLMTTSVTACIPAEAPLVEHPETKIAHIAVMFRA